MFFGEYPYRVDEKGRVPLPPRFRRGLKEGLILTQGTENCITIYPISQWRRVSDKLAEKALNPANLRKLTRAIFGSAFDTSFDGQGRITLLSRLREYAGIGDTAIVVGVNTHVEIWSEEQWKAEKASADEEASQIIESLEYS